MGRVQSRPWIGERSTGGEEAVGGSSTETSTLLRTTQEWSSRLIQGPKKGSDPQNSLMCPGARRTWNQRSCHVVLAAHGGWWWDQG